MIGTTGYGAKGCDPLSNAGRIAAWRHRLDTWIAMQPDPMAADVVLGRRATEGLALQKALRKRKRFKFRKTKPTTNTNVVQLRVQRRA